VPEFARRDWGKPRNTSGRGVDVAAEIRSEHLPSTSVTAKPTYFSP
jgi:hypothetical protein